MGPLRDLEVLGVHHVGRHRVARTRSPAPWAALTLVAIGCALAPEDVAGQYDLVRAGGDPIPSVIYASSSCSLTVTGGALSLHEDATFEMSWRETLDCSGAGGSPNTMLTGAVGDFALDGNRITLHPTGESTGYKGRVAGDAISVAWRPIYAGFLFARQ